MGSTTLHFTSTLLTGILVVSGFLPLYNTLQYIIQTSFYTGTQVFVGIAKTIFFQYFIFFHFEVDLPYITV